MVDYPLPKSWYEASEKYKNQTKLVKLDTGGYSLEGYRAGTPFPDYSGPEEAYKILYNLYYHYSGSINHYESDGYELDRYLSETKSLSYQVFLQFTHMTDPGFPGYAREMPGYFSSYYDELEQPEQSKYTSPLELLYDNPQKVPEYYVFLPSLRRALRLSSGAPTAALSVGACNVGIASPAAGASLSGTVSVTVITLDLSFHVRRGRDAGFGPFH
jgi:Protein of unknown function (DUF1329)